MSRKKIKSFNKKETMILSFIALTLGGYYCGVEGYSVIATTKGEISEIVEENTEISLVNKFINSSHVYLSNNDSGKIKIFSEYIQSIKEFLNTSTMQIREPLNFDPVYEGLSSSGVKLYTDLDVIKFEEFDKVKYYKVSEGVKKDFSNLLTKAIYFSTGSLKNCSNWTEISVKYNNLNEEKVIRRSDYEEFASKLSVVRNCGRIQPEKSLANAQKTFEVSIKTKNHITYNILVMGKDYIKIELDSQNYEYFEVKNAFYDYLSSLFAE